MQANVRYHRRRLNVNQLNVISVSLGKTKQIASLISLLCYRFDQRMEYNRNETQQVQI